MYYFLVKLLLRTTLFCDKIFFNKLALQNILEKANRQRWA